MNNVVLMGRLVADPETREANGTMVSRYTLAVDRRFKRDGEQSADFIRCVAFGKSAEFTDKYLKKGTKICIQGRIQTGSYTNKDGDKVFTTDVVVENQEFAESKAAAQQNAQAEQTPTKKTAPAFINVESSELEALPFD